METQAQALERMEPNAPADYDLHARLKALLKDGDWVDYFCYHLTSKHKDLQPLDFAVMCQADLPTIQQLHAKGSGSIHPDTFRLACKNGARPGVIPFLAENFPELVSEPDEDGDYPISMAMEKGPGKMRPTESDIKSLIIAWPEGLVIATEFHDYIMCTPIQQCLNQGYSLDLLDFMLRNIPEQIRRFEMDEIPIKVNARHWIAHILPKIEEELICRACDWNEEVFLEFLRLVFLGRTPLKRLKFNLPNRFLDADGSRTEHDPNALSLWKEQMKQSQESPRIVHLDICCALPTAMGYFCLLDSLPKWSSLRNLTLDVGHHLDSSLAAICKTLELGCLESLDITVDPAASIVNWKRKRDEEEIQSLLKPLFDVLTTNITLKRLTLGGVRCQEYECNLKLCVKALKQNTTLQDVIGLDPNSYLISLVNQGAVDLYAQMDCHLVLNLCGRKLARDSTTLLVDLVSLLGSVEDRLEAKTRGELEELPEKMVTGIQYGLLRKAVGKWASSISIGRPRTQRANLNRKK